MEEQFQGMYLRLDEKMLVERFYIEYIKTLKHPALLTQQVFDSIVFQSI